VIYIQRIYDSRESRYVYYSLGAVTTTPLVTDPTYSLLTDLVASTHVVIATTAEGELTVFSDGSVITMAAASIDFTGAVATAIGDAVTVTAASISLFDIASFTKTAPNSGTLVYRRGDTLTGITAAATYVDGPPTIGSIANVISGSTNGGDIAPGSWTFSTPFATGSLAGSILRIGSDLGADPTLTATVTATKTGITKYASIAIVWTRDVYYGVAASGLTTEGDIESLANTILSGTRVRTLNLTPSTQKVYYAYPKAYGTATFILNSFPFDMLPVIEVSVTNINGVASTYYLYESTNLLTGSISIIVS
jgi:hypothetical protein